MIDRSTLRVALRTLARHRGFTAVAILSLAVAIALNTTMYSAMDAMLDPRINARQPDHIYTLSYYAGARLRPTTDVIEEALRGGMRTYEGVTGSRGFSGNWRRVPLAENGSRYMRVQPFVVRPNYFDFLGGRPLEGRTFLPRDESEANVVVISDRLARKLYPDESPVGRSLLLEGQGYTVIGVVERNSTFLPLWGDLWLMRQANSPPVAFTLIRFRDKIDPTDIDKQLEVVAARLALATGTKPGETAFVGKQLAVRDYTISSFEWALVGAVAAVLLVACANLANLQLARGLSRSRELALRSAVGASRRQLVGHLLLESGLLALGGLALGLVLTLWGVYILKASITPILAGVMIEPQTSWKMFVFATAAALLCLFLVGLVPALQVSKVDPDTLLKAGSGTGANREHRKRYGVMVIAQIGFALPVLIGAIVVFLGALRMHNRSYFTRDVYGYDPGPIVAANVPIVQSAGAKVVHFADAAAELTSRAKAIPGIIDAAAYVSQRPDRNMVTIDDANGSVREAMAHLWSYRTVSPSYFRVFGRAMARGRDFGESEFDGSAVIMDARSAKYLWGNENPIGRSIKFGYMQSREPWHRVVGIVGDLRDTFAIRRRDPYANFHLSEVYRVITPRDSLVVRVPPPFMGRVPAAMIQARYTMTLYGRARGNTELAAVRMQRVLRSVKGAEAPSAIPLEDDLGISFWRIRQDFVASLFTTFALLGLGLVAIGVYGIVSHTIAERRRELAVRISLGATSRNILHSVLREGNVLILSGVAIGLLFTKYTVMWLDQYFSGANDGYDAPLFALIAAFLFAIAAFAAFLPALRATRIDPVEALRHE
jgi:putative ABC transport system permease protein